MTCADSSSNPLRGGLLLAVNGADERLQAALGTFEDGRAQLLAAQEWNAPGQAARFLAPGIRNMLDALGRQAQDISRMACVTGPGSFTGLRMSLALAEGLAAGLAGGAHPSGQDGDRTGPLLAGIGHLELLALEAAEAAPGAVLALAWSRRGQVYAQAFTGRTALTAPLVVQLADMPAFLNALPRPLAILGGGLRRNQEFFQAHAQADPAISLLPLHWDAPRPHALLALAAEAPFGPGPLTPAYLRASDAEDNLAAIASGRGLSEAEAQAILSRGSRTLS